MVEVVSPDGKKHHVGKLDENGNPVVTQIVPLASDFANASSSMTASSAAVLPTLKDAQIAQADLSDAGAQAAPGIATKARPAGPAV